MVVRVRPFLESESRLGKKGKIQCVQTKHPHDDTELCLIRPGFDMKEFQYDHVLDMDQS